MTWWYDVAFTVFALGALPHFLLRLRQARAPATLLRERLGFFSPLKQREWMHRAPVWLHAVSVGEVLGVKHLFEACQHAAPELPLLLSTVTPTGQAVAERLCTAARIPLVYFPFDLKWVVRRVMDAIRPKLILLMETELWPNLICEAARRGIPVGIVNGRLSAKSCERYQLVQWALAPAWSSLTFVLAQTDADRDRFIKVGVVPDRVHVVGNMKFDEQVTPRAREVDSEQKTTLGYASTDRIVVAGSTHRGEERLLFQAARKLREAFPDVYVIVAPRHIERAREIATLARAHGFTVGCLSEAHPRSRDKSDVLIVDVIGRLASLYAVADAVFMGGSLIPHGGQNPVEASIVHKPIAVGPHYANFQFVYDQLLARGGALQVRDATTLCHVIKQWLLNRDSAARHGQAAYETIRSLRGATQRTLDFLAPWLRQATGEVVHAQ